MHTLVVLILFLCCLIIKMKLTHFSQKGGNVEVLSVDDLGVVEIRFRGANKVKQGLELAVRDVKNVKHVKFVN